MPRRVRARSESYYRRDAGESALPWATLSMSLDAAARTRVLSGHDATPTTSCTKSAEKYERLADRSP